MIIAIIILAWLLANTLASLVVVCLDGGTPVRRSDWFGIGLSCVLSPAVVLFVIQPIANWITRLRRKRKKK
jgi:putative effector of murein hydrolase LrgA (UPF0299 family)